MVTKQKTWLREIGKVFLGNMENGVVSSGGSEIEIGDKNKYNTQYTCIKEWKNKLIEI